MNTPERNPSGRTTGPILGNDGAWLAAALDLYPFPALAVEAGSGRKVLVNEPARQLGLGPAPGADGSAASYATDGRGRRIESGELARYLFANACGDGGAEITWHTPERSASFRAFCRPLPAAKGRPELAVLTFLDVTREKAAEAELRQALEARDEFFSVATHELKDPLFALQLSIQLLRHAAEKQGEVPDHVRRHLEVSHRQADRLARLIDNLLDVARIANRRLRLDLEALDLSDLAREMVERAQEKALAAGTTVEADCPEPVIGYFDRMKLEQVVSNLLTNALKYGAGRPVRVRVWGDDGMAVLEVQDQGAGIAPEDHERIFRRFERASESHKQASLGLGLYIVRALVEAHGGTITVHSEPGRGATFTVALPRKRLQPAPEDGGGQEPTEG